MGGFQIITKKSMRIQLTLTYYDNSKKQASADIIETVCFSVFSAFRVFSNMIFLMLIFRLFLLDICDSGEWEPGNLGASDVIKENCDNLINFWPRI